MSRTIWSGAAAFALLVAISVTFLWLRAPSRAVDLEVQTSVYNPGIVISSKSEPQSLDPFPSSASIPLIAFLTAKSWNELAPFYSESSRAIAESNGQAKRIDERVPKVFQNTLSSLSEVSLPDGKKVLFIQLIPQEFRGDTNSYALWAPVILVSERGSWKNSLDFSSKELTWFLTVISPDDLIKKKDEFKALISEGLHGSGNFR